MNFSSRIVGGIALALLLAQTFTPALNAQTFYNNTGPTATHAAYGTADEIADDVPFTGIQHVASFTFEYRNGNPGPVSAIVRFYLVNQTTGLVGALVATVPVTNLPPGDNRLFTVNLDPTQQFDWFATPGIYGLQSITGGFVSFQFSGPVFSDGWYEASGPSLDGFVDVTTHQFTTFQGDTSASFYLQVSGSTTASTLSAVTLNPATVKGGFSSQATITLTGAAPPAGLVVTLSTSKPKLAQLPTSVTIPGGASSAVVALTTKAVLANTNVTISASLNGALKVARLSITR